MIGFSGDFNKSMLMVPNNENIYIKRFFLPFIFHEIFLSKTKNSVGSLLCIENINDAHDQRFFRGHDMPVSYSILNKTLL